MTNRSRKLLVGALVAGVLAAGVSPVTAAADPVHLELRANVTNGFPGALAYVREGERERRFGVGVANLATGERARPHQRFRTASITKSFTATVLLQLVAEGELGLDDPVERWLPGVLPDRGVTVRQLLDHTSRVYDPASTPEFFAPYLEHQDWGHVITPAEVIRRAVAHGPYPEPAYSNTNYLLAGLVVERVTGHDFGTELRNRILAPLRLHHTELPLTDPRLHGPHLHGYNLAREDHTTFSPSYDWTAGAIVSTVDDVAKFQRALLGGELLPPELTALGLGLEPFALPCEGGTQRVQGSQGSGPGYFSFAYTSEDRSRQIVVVLNSYDLGADVGGQGKQPYPGPREGPLPALSAALCQPAT
ncbi:serine hydrolase domain-containing protein [Amycolatopsis albispora]|uniref:Beta-lactamase-related domain-containing protein n=1 Tax=Amycolatopsis albispora TaxID=1804986 RepID=A0A344LD38_9PSEU|nr:serine hydrolase domain-containing protein [Amycolatopsis albispora]AXB45962.1 hypothetical protein A4R43_28665 [Amycolatopsis albispora]